MNLVRGFLAFTVAVAGGGLVFATLGASQGPSRQASPQLATVSQRSFPVVVSASGVLLPAIGQQLNFGAAGRVAEIDVKVGDQVKSGQLLAKLDDGIQQAGLSQATAELSIAQAILNNAQNPLTPARQQKLQNSVDLAQAASDGVTTLVNQETTADAAAVATDTQRLSDDQTRYSNDGCDPTVTTAPCPADARAVAADQAALAAAQDRQTKDLVSGPTRVAQAAAALSAAQAALAAAAQPDPQQVDRATSEVAAAQARVDLSTANLNRLQLVAAVDGTVLSINGNVGDTVSGAATAGVNAPGATAPLPKSKNNTGRLTLNSTAFISLGDPTTYLVAAAFSQADAVRLAAGQAATVSVDAIPGASLASSVLAVADQPTTINGQVAYYATVTADGLDGKAKAGLTATVSVTVAQATDVLAVPTSAVYPLDGKQLVDVWYRGRLVPTPVETGLTGTQLTEVTSGLYLGEQVVLSSRRALPPSTVQQVTSVSGG